MSVKHIYILSAIAMVAALVAIMQIGGAGQAPPAAFPPVRPHHVVYQVTLPPPAGIVVTMHLWSHGLRGLPKRFHSSGLFLFK